MTAAEIAAIGACIAALGTLLTGVAVVITASRTGHSVEAAADKLAETTEATTTATGEKLDEIHVLVNSRLTEALAKIERLELRLGDEPTGGD